MSLRLNQLVEEAKEQFGSKINSATKVIGKHKVEVIGVIEDAWNYGLRVSIDGKQYDVFKQGGMNLWAFSRRPELEKTLDMNQFDSFLLEQWKRLRK